MVDVLCNHVSLNSKTISSYEPNLSKKNIGKYKKILNQQEIDLIERNLSEYIHIK